MSFVWPSSFEWSEGDPEEIFFLEEEIAGMI
jgi:hypothetical protein